VDVQHEGFDDEIANFRRVGAEISANIKAIEAKFAAAPNISIYE
jgi:hypothetical protein